MSKKPVPKLQTLPIVRLSRASRDPGSNFLRIEQNSSERSLEYWRSPRPEGASKWTVLLKMPVVLDSTGAPWAEACLWLLSRAEANPNGTVGLQANARALRDYLEHLEALSVDWRDFSSPSKSNRPTYLYRTRLSIAVNSGALASSTASGRMSSVIQFYRFLQADVRMAFKPKHPPWIEKDVTISVTDAVGRRQLRTVKTTDLRMREKSQDDPFLETIKDGGKLRPLSAEEQKALVSALKAVGNREYSLMHYISIFTGAREMTALTLPWGLFLKKPSEISVPFKFRCGPGTGIDTKNNVTNVWLSMPKWLYIQLHEYATSMRAERRRAKSKKKNDPSNYLFLTSHGGPYYESKDDLEKLKSAHGPLKKSSPIGQNLREFIKLRVIPEVRKTLPHFTYRYHDLRATFGVNWVDSTMADSKSPEKFAWARDQLRKLMWHRSAVTTDEYLAYRRRSKDVEEAQHGWENYLTALVDA